MKRINPYRSPQSHHATTPPEAEPETKSRTGVWRAASIVSFMLLMFVPTGMMILISNGTPAKHVRFWWAYAPDSVLEFGFRFYERAGTAIAHVVLSLLLGFMIQFLASFFPKRDSIDISK